MQVFASLKYNFNFYTDHFTHGEHHTVNILYRCFGKDFLTNIYVLIGLFLVPLNKFLIYPLFYRCISIKIRWKILLGTLLELVGFIVLLILITYTRSKYTETTLHPHNYTFHCVFHEKSNSLMNDICSLTTDGLFWWSSSLLLQVRCF